MPNEIQNLAYCRNCSENVPHFRNTTGVVGRLLEMLRIGPWHCLNCQQKKMILPAVRRDSTEFSFDRSNDPVGSGKPAKRSVSPFKLVEPKEDSELAIVGGGLGHGPERQDSLDPKFVNGTASQMQRNRKREVELKSRHQSEDLSVAEPVGNFIKERSLVLKSARMHRFTQKYRDSVVNRILAGKVSVSSLTAHGEFGEAELASWIADMQNRQAHPQEERDEVLDLGTDPRWSK